jgi:hypothetical protein
MILRTLALTATVAVMIPLAAAADAAGKAREIDTTGLKLVPPPSGKATEPAVVASAAELAKSPVLGGAADALGKQVDFAKEKLVVFAWAGSGQDKVTAGAVKDKTAAFTYTRGLTRDLRPHVKVFAIPKDATPKVEAGK